MRRTLIGLALLANLLVGTAMGHHGAYEYDLNTVRMYEGVVLEHVWKNPHSLIILETQSESGKPLRLEIEGGGPSGLAPVGVTGHEIVVGERVSVAVNPSRRFPNRSAGIEFITADGDVVPLRPGANATARQSNATASSIFGTWAAPWETFMGMVASRASWGFTAAGRNAFESYNPTMSSQAQCIPVSAPWLMVQPVVHEIERLDNQIVISSDWMGAVRTVYLDGRAHPPLDEQFQQGHSTGRWEGDVLVVDTTNFTDRIYAGLASSGTKHLVERWSLSQDGKRLDYSFVLEDPEYLAEPVSGMYQWNYRPDLDPSGVECDLELAERYVREFR